MRWNGWMDDESQEIERIYWEEGLSVRRRARKKITTVPRVALSLLHSTGMCYAMNFVQDRLANDQWFTRFTMTNLCPKEVRLIEVVAQSEVNGSAALWIGSLLDGRGSRP